MTRGFKSVSSLVIEKILPYISYMIILLSIVLEIAAKKSMGFQRDLIYRKGLLENSILTFDLLNIYKWIVLAGIVFCTIIIISKGDTFSDRLKKYIHHTIALSIVFVIMIIFYTKVTLVAYPLMVLSIGISVVFQYIRIVNR